MKVHKHIFIADYSGLRDFASDHIGEAFTFCNVTSEFVNIMQEVEQTDAEIHMKHLRTMLGCDDYLTEEEKAALEYSIDCIKTLNDMGVIK